MNNAHEFDEKRFWIALFSTFVQREVKANFVSSPRHFFVPYWTSSFPEKRRERKPMTVERVEVASKQ